MSLKGKVIKYGDNINTDEIIPARYCTTVEYEELARHCMEDLDNLFASKVNKGDTIMAGENFGCGSSREMAPIAIKASGISCVIAKSFARIFYRNAINIGLPVIECEELVNETEENNIVEIDLEKGTIVNTATNKQYSFIKGESIISSIIESGGLMNLVKQRVNQRKKLEKRGYEK